MKYYLAIDVGGTYTKYAIITDHHEIIMKSKFKTIKTNLEEFLQGIVDLYEKMRKEYEVAGIALSMPGFIDSETGYMANGGALFFIKEFNIVEALEQRVPVKVTVENDAKSAALAEVWNGALKDVQDGVVIVLGTSVGGAVIRDRKVVRGRHMVSGEFSFLIMNADGDLRYEDTWGFRNGAMGLAHAVSKRTGIPVEELNGEIIFEHANNGEEPYIEGLREFAKTMANAIFDLEFIVDPDRYCIGGGISVQPLLLQLVQEQIDAMYDAINYNIPKPEVTTCKYYNDANLLGAVYSHIDR